LVRRFMEIEDNLISVQDQSSSPVALKGEEPRLAANLNYRPPEKQRLKKKKYIISALILLIIILIITETFFLKTSLFQKIINLKGGTTPQIPEITFQLGDRDVFVNLGVGFKVGIDKNWDVEVVESGKKHNFLKARDDSGTKLEIEAFSHSLENWQNYLKNPLFEIEQTESRTIGGNQVKIEKGKEMFAQSKTRTIVGIWETKEKTLVVRSEASDQSLAEQMFNRLAETVSYSDNRTSSLLLKTQEAFAAEDRTPPELPKIEYKQIEIMAPLVEDEITRNDVSYKDGFAKGYKFLAFKSQGLKTIVFEDRQSNPNSFVHSQIFDFNGNEISEEKDTNIEFKAPYTGEYFIVVSSFNQQEGKIKIGVVDRDQTEIKAFIKYPDGAELFAEDIQVGEFEVGLIIQIPKIITIYGENTIEYEPLPESFEKNLETINGKIEAFMSPDLFKRKGLQNFFKHIDNNNQYRVNIKMVQLGANRLLITPVEGLFPKNYQVSVEGIRFFTQNKPVINLPIMQQILNDYPDDFGPLQESYFDWALPNGEMKEILGGWLQGSEPREIERLDQLKQYFIDKDYAVDENNVNVALPPMSVNNAGKASTGVVNGSTVCRLEYFGILNVYCGNLP